jgi:hypothetical protein
MDDRTGTFGLEQVGQASFVAYVLANKAEKRIAGKWSQELPISRGEVIYANYRKLARQKVFHNVGTEESGCAGHQPWL